MAAKNGGKKAPPPEEAPKQRPAHEARYGRLKATVWRQESDKGPWYSVVLTRAYQDQQGAWKSSQSFGRDDLLLVAKLCDEVHTWIYGQLRKEASARAGQTNGQGEGGQGQGDDSIPF